MKFRFEKDIFYLFKDNKKKFFINENTLAKEMIEQLNEQNIKIYDYEKDLKIKDNYLTQIINQYEEKLKKLNQEKEEILKQFKTLQTAQDLIKNEKERAKIGKQARESVKKYTSDIVGEEWITLIEESDIYD